MALAELTIQSTEREYARAAWLLEGPPTPHTLCLLLDGEYYRDNLEAFSTISALMDRGSIPPLTVLFVSHGSSAARHADYIGDASFARFVADDVVSAAKARVPSLTDDRHLICGVSLSGLAAAHIALLYPDRFPAALCQSGSFWYEPDRFAALARERPPTKTRFWLSVGDEETAVNVTHPPSGIFQDITQIAGVERARAVLTETGADVSYHLFHGGHAFEPWRAELGDALQWLLR